MRFLFTGKQGRLPVPLAEPWCQAQRRGWHGPALQDHRECHRGESKEEIHGWLHFCILYEFLQTLPSKMTISTAKCDVFLAWEDPSEILNLTLGAWVLVTVSERDFVLFCPFVEVVGRAKMMLLNYFPGISQNQDAASIHLFQLMALYPWRALATHVVSKTSAVPRESPDLQRILSIELPNCKADS